MNRASCLLVPALTALLVSPGPAFGDGPRADRSVSERLAWLPPEVRSVLGSHAWKGLPTLRFYASTVGGRLPPCWDQQLGGLGAAFQIWRAKGDTNGVLAEGTLDRDAAEKCMLEALQALDKTLPGLKMLPRLERKGALTQVFEKPDSSVYVGWGPGWTIWHPDRAWVEQLLTASRAKGSKGPKPSPMGGLLGRVVDAPDRFWAVSLDDFSDAFIGVPSRGFILSIPLKKPAPGEEPRGSLLFGSVQEARRAVRAFQGSAESRELDPAIRSFIGSLRPRQSADAVEFEMDGFRLADPAFLQAAQAAVDKKKAAAGVR